MKKIIWQYWETKKIKPAYIDGLYEIAKKNSGVDVVQVTPETLSEYLCNVPKELHQIEELAHKADMIRSMLIYEHGGMWLDSDAIVLKDLNWLFEFLNEYEFVGFNDSGRIIDERDTDIRVNCFLARPKSSILSKWVHAQHQKFPKISYEWTEIGTDLLGPICLENRQKAKIIPFRKICPIGWREVEKFTSKLINPHKVMNDAAIIMLSNQALYDKNIPLTKLSISEIVQGDYLLSEIIKKALDKSYEPEKMSSKLIRFVYKFFFK